MEHRDTAGEKAAMIVDRLEFPVRDRKDVGHPCMNSCNRIDARISFHDGGVKPSFERGGIFALDDLSFEVHGKKLVFSNQREANSWCYEKEIRIGNSNANMTKSHDQFLVREDPACADNVFFELAS